MNYNFQINLDNCILEYICHAYLSINDKNSWLFLFDMVKLYGNGIKIIIGGIAW